MQSRFWFYFDAEPRNSTLYKDCFCVVAYACDDYGPSYSYRMF